MKDKNTIKHIKELCIYIKESVEFDSDMDLRPLGHMTAAPAPSECVQLFGERAKS